MENTALGFYWDLGKKDWFADESKNGKKLCSACCPKVFADGSKTDKGEWHNKFPRVQWDGKREVVNREVKK